MARQAAHRDVEVEFALVRQDRLHAGRLADDAEIGAQAGLVQILRSAACTPLAADFFVVADEQMQRAGQRSRAWKSGTAARQAATKPFMSQAAAGEQLAVAAAQRERIAGPGLTIDRHRIDMAAERQAAGLPRADDGVQIGLLSGCVGADAIAARRDRRDSRGRSRSAPGSSCGWWCRTTPAAPAVRSWSSGSRRFGQYP